MPAPFANEDITGKRFAKLVAIRIVARAPIHATDGFSSRKKLMVEFKCDCGNTKTISYADVRNGHTKSCGCLISEITIRRNTKHGQAKRGNISPEWSIWNLMNNRCHNICDKSYNRHGGRGISVCERWRGSDGFKNFFEDMGKRPSKDHSLDRIDNSKGYTPENCRWTDIFTQANNKRNNVRLSLNGKPYTVAQLMRHFGLKRSSMYYSRIKRGWSVERTFTELPIPKKTEMLR